MVEQKAMSGVDAMRVRAIFCFAFLALSCSQVDIPSDGNDVVSGEYERVVMVMPSCEFDEGPQTRNEVLLSGGIKYVWSETDTVGIFPNTGSQLYFSMASGAGEQSASFDGGGWALVRGAEYYSYFPFVPDFYIDKTAVPLTFVGQSQAGNADPVHAYLGDYCYMAAKGEYDQESDALYFNYQRLGVLFRFMIPVKAGAYQSLTVRADDEILVQSGTFNVMNVDQIIYDPVYSDSLMLEFAELTLDADGTLVAFMVLPPFDMSSKQLTFELMTESGEKHLASVPGKSYVLGKTYNNAPSFSVSLSSYEVEGKGGSVQLNVVASGAVEYNLYTDSDWITLSQQTGTGSSSFDVSVASNTGAKRTGHIIVTETSNGMLLQNVMTLTQDIDGMDVGVGDWEDGEDDGGVAV